MDDLPDFCPNSNWVLLRLWVLHWGQNIHSLKSLSHSICKHLCLAMHSSRASSWICNLKEWEKKFCFASCNNLRGVCKITPKESVIQAELSFPQFTESTDTSQRWKITAKKKSLSLQFSRQKWCFLLLESLRFIKKTHLDFRSKIFLSNSGNLWRENSNKSKKS